MLENLLGRLSDDLQEVILKRDQYMRDTLFQQGVYHGAIQTLQSLRDMVQEEWTAEETLKKEEEANRVREEIRELQNKKKREKRAAAKREKEYMISGKVTDEDLARLDRVLDLPIQEKE